MINAYLQNTTEMDDNVIHLLFSANRWEKAQWIENTLQKGYTIICDRYYYSGISYSAAKQNPNLSLDWARAPDVGLPKPDGIVFLDLEPKQAELRGGYGEEKYEKKEFQGRVRELFLRLLSGKEERDEVIVNAGETVDVVEERVWKVVLPLVERVQGGACGEKVRRVEG